MDLFQRLLAAQHSMDGMLSVAPTFESAGGMAKTVTDLAALVEVILRAAKSPRNFTVNLGREWSEFKLGFVDSSLWRLPPELFTSTDEYCRQVVSLAS